MTDKNKGRSVNFLATKYHRRVMAVAFFPTVLIFGVVLFFLSAFYQQLVDVIIYSSTTATVELIQDWGVMLLFLLGSTSLLILFWAYVLSRDLVGAFERILKELDAMIDGGERKHIRVRKGDDPAVPVVARINTLIDNLPHDKKNLRVKN